MTGPNTQTTHERHRRLHRQPEGRLVAGVAAGIAAYLAVDTAAVRVAFVVLGFCGGMALPLYLAAWLLIPEQGTDVAIADRLITDRSVVRPGAWTR